MVQDRICTKGEDFPYLQPGSKEAGAACPHLTKIGDSEIQNTNLHPLIDASILSMYLSKIMELYIFASANQSESISCYISFNESTIGQVHACCGFFLINPFRVRAATPAYLSQSPLPTAACGLTFK